MIKSIAHAHANIINSMISFHKGDLKKALITAKNSRYKGQLVKSVCVEVLQQLAKPEKGQLSYGEGLVIGEVVQNVLRIRNNNAKDAILLIKSIMPEGRYYSQVLAVLKDIAHK